MIVNDQSFNEFCKDLGPILAEWTETIIPEEVEPLPNNRYSPAYDWMYAYEKRLKYRIEDLIGKSLGQYERILFGADGVLSEALSNAFVHGHRRNRELPIEVHTRVGQAGLVFLIRDQGNGFDVEQALASASGGGSYFCYAGNGLKAFLTIKEVLASYSKGGRSLSICVRLDPK